MSSLIRRIEKRIMRKANVEKVFSHTLRNDDGTKEDVFVWPRLIPASAKPETRKIKRAYCGAYREGRPERGRRRGKHSKVWIEARASARSEAAAVGGR